VIKDCFPFSFMMRSLGCVNILSLPSCSLNKLYPTFASLIKTLKHMAKEPAKKPAVKKAPAKKTSSSLSASQVIEAASETSLQKLRDLNLDHQLQSEIDWCLASYRSDGNPVGLYHMVERTIGVLKGELAKKTKGVTAKLITDLEKALATR
jgi:hypothetical protein